MILPYTGQSIPDLLQTGSSYAQVQQAWDLYVDSVIGQAYTPSQLNINQDLPFGNNNATLLRSTRYVSQTGALNTAADYNATYFQSGNFFVIDQAGNQIQMTAGGTLNASLIGGITALAGTPASVVYYQPATQFQFYYSASLPANMLIASLSASGVSASQGSFTTLSASGLSLSSLSLSTLTVTNETAVSGVFGYLTASNVLAQTAVLTSSNIVRGTVTTLTSSNALMTSMTASDFRVSNNAFVQTLSASVSVLTTLTASNVSASQGYFSVLTASSIIGTLTASSLSAPVGIYTTLSGTNTYVAQTLSASTINATTATITTINATTMNPTTVNATTVNGTTLSGSTMQTTVLNAKGAATLSGTVNIGSNLNVTGTISSTGDLNSAGGYRQTVGGAIYFLNNGTLPTTDQLLQQIFYDTAGGFTYVYWRFIAPAAGSLIGLSAFSTGPTITEVTTITAYKNGVSTALSGVMAAGNTSVYGGLLAKDTITFVAGDQLQLRVKYSAATPSSTVGVAAYLTVEF